MTGDSVLSFDLICIGSGPAGQRAAIQAAKLGKRVAVIERQRCIGGVCVETGTIPSKTFREAVQRSFSRPGLAGDTRTRVRPTMEQLLTHVQYVIDREIHVVEDNLRRNDIEVFRGAARLITATSVEVEGVGGRVVLHGDHLLIAVGTRPSEPPGVPCDGVTVMTSDGLLGLRSLPRSLAVIGAGVIGIEYASMFAALGVEVTIIDRRPRPLEFLDHEIVELFERPLHLQRIVGDAEARAEVILDRNWGAVEETATTLLERETLSGVALDAVLSTVTHVPMEELLEIRRSSRHQRWQAPEEQPDPEEDPR